MRLDNVLMSSRWGRSEVWRTHNFKYKKTRRCADARPCAFVVVLCRAILSRHVLSCCVSCCLHLSCRVSCVVMCCVLLWLGVLCCVGLCSVALCGDVLCCVVVSCVLLCVCVVVCVCLFGSHMISPPSFKPCRALWVYFTHAWNRVECGPLGFCSFPVGAFNRSCGCSFAAVVLNRPHVSLCVQSTCGPTSGDLLILRRWNCVNLAYLSFRDAW